ncbi:MAG: type II toxin-antitoxin system RelE/ParE family toxin [Chromatiales bacterium]|nr:type II toxin-antitoxin system RelE/ParE family toxin [Chromatiales bacterium]
MANYEIQFKKSVAKDLRSIPKNDVRKILERIDALAKNPRAEGCIRLSGQKRYRTRQGVYRIIYEVKDAEIIVVVVKIGHRSQVYKGS